LQASKSDKWINS